MLFIKPFTINFCTLFIFLITFSILQCSFYSLPLFSSNLNTEDKVSYAHLSLQDSNLKPNRNKYIFKLEN